ncbi:phage tail-collar fiber domain-containing protein [Clostridium tyrobutyricum]|uniref:phage tail-collar fiber domain-containing protein n=1 Tax=Clostridium tyrobutyricum TaxID=1519 RepID=UPI001C38B2C3|nr:phage tail protein [Clostridium tyrobutyricum]MBV4440198.1 phage tail protein [Clostridium tyrobutyricum]
MAETFYTILTNIGKAKIANAAALGTDINITKFAVGDGNGSYYNPTEDQITLKNEVWHGNTTSVNVDPDNPNWIVAGSIITATDGGFMIREAAIFDTDDDMIAIGKYPETYKPLVTEGSAKDLNVKMIIEVSNASSVTLKINPSVLFATKTDLNNLAGAGRTTETVKGNSDDIKNLKEDFTSHLAEKANIKQTNDTSIKLNQSMPYLNVLNAKARQSDMNNIINAIANGGMSGNLIDSGLWVSQDDTNVTVTTDSSNNIIITGVNPAVGAGILANLQKNIISGHKYRLSITAKTNDISKGKHFGFSDGTSGKGTTKDFYLASEFTTNIYDFLATDTGNFKLGMSSSFLNTGEILTIQNITLQELNINPDNINNNLIIGGYSLGNVVTNTNNAGTGTIHHINNGTIEIQANDNLTEFRIGLKNALQSGKVYKITYIAKTSMASDSPAKRFSFKNSGTTVGASTYLPLSTDFKTYEEYVQLTGDALATLYLHSNVNFVAGEIMTISELKVEEVQEEIEGNNSLYMLPRPVIWDTDWWTDCDDVMAARILLWAERARLIDIVCITMDACQDNSVPSLDAFLTNEGRPGIPIGIDHSAIDYGGTPPYQQNMLSYPHSYKSSADAEDAVHMYRRALASCAQKIDIICVGYTNNLSNLLKSPADDISPLTGLQLVIQKVNKLWLMAGHYPNGSENNFTRNTRSRQAGAYVCANWPTPIIFLGWEAGNTVISGSPLKNYAPNDMVTKALADHGFSNGRSSWDPMLTLLACYGDLETAGYDSKKGTVSVDSSTGANTFVFDDNGKHEYVRKMYSDSWYVNKINNIIMPVYSLGFNQISK